MQEPIDPSEQLWYYLDPAESDPDKLTKGPFLQRDIDVMLRTNLLNSNAMMFSHGITAEWTQLHQIPQLRECLQEQEQEILHFRVPVKPQERKLSAQLSPPQQPIAAAIEEFYNDDEDSEFLDDLPQLTDEARKEILKKKIEKNRKKSQKEKQKKKQKWYTPKINTNVYVQGLPPDITAEEMKNAFSKAGIIRINPETLQPIIKIYLNDKGECKGDGLVSYKMYESVSVAKDLLNDMEIRPGCKIAVSEAIFQQKGDYRKREDKKIDSMKRVLARQKEMSQLAWEGQENEGEGFKIVVLRNLFDPPQSEEFFQELYGEILFECETTGGEVHKLEIFPENPQGVAKVKFESAYDAEQFIQQMNGKPLLGREIKVAYWDGKENFKHVREDKAVEQQRLEEFGKWLEEQQEDDPQ